MPTRVSGSSVLAATANGAPTPRHPKGPGSSKPPGRDVCSHLAVVDTMSPPSAHTMVSSPKNSATSRAKRSGCTGEASAAAASAAADRLGLLGRLDLVEPRPNDRRRPNLPAASPSCAATTPGSADDPDVGTPVPADLGRLRIDMDHLGVEPNLGAVSGAEVPVDAEARHHVGADETPLTEPDCRGADGRTGVSLAPGC